jgi:hypothetical protein
MRAEQVEWEEDNGVPNANTIQRSKARIRRRIIRKLRRAMKKTPGLSPPANYTDRATAACLRS